MGDAAQLAAQYHDEAAITALKALKLLTRADRAGLDQAMAIDWQQATHADALLSALATGSEDAF